MNGNDDYQVSRPTGKDLDKDEISSKMKPQFDRSEAYMSIYESPVQTQDVSPETDDDESQGTDTKSEVTALADDESQGTDTKSAVTALAEDPKRGYFLRDIWMPNNFRRVQQSSEKDTFGLVKDWLIFLKELLLMIVLMEILPTVDIATDLRIAIIWFSTRRAWAISIFCTLLGHTFCSAVLWYYLEPRKMKKYSWIFVIFQVFPQYRAAYIIYHFARKSSDNDAVQENRNIYDRMISTVEPYVESVPQVIILTASFYSGWGNLTGNLDDVIALEQVTGVANEKTRLGYFDIPYFFYVSFGLSCFSASWGITMFFKKGPIRFLPTNGLITLDLVVALLGTSCFILWRLIMFASMISSTGYLIPLVYTVPLGQDIMNGQCETIVGVETDVSFKLKTNETEYYNSKWNCEDCGRKDMLSGFCNKEGDPIEGSCRTDCDCPPCHPFCSVWEWCQRTARYGRKPRTKTQCQEIWKTPDKCRKPPTSFNELDDNFSYERCNMRIWVRYEISNKTASWGSKPPFFLQRGSKYVVVWDQETTRVLYSISVDNMDLCQQDRNQCEEWQIPQQFFCTEPVTAGLFVWIGIFILPTFLFNLVILIVTLQSNFFGTILHYPQLLFQGIFGLFLFGPLDRIHFQWGCKKLQLSGTLTFTNFLLTILQLTLGLYILSRNYAWGYIFQNSQYIDLLPLEEKNAIHAIEIQLILSVVLLIIVCISSFFVFVRISEKGQLDPRNP
eukprot:GFUD01001522.1.p1 GENE.GFUD01001522.1~~GFUD01001522.1.p1  ORF type:complete len:729 (+),score=77.61 GFUD01001522.1:102-2288(+)